MRIAVLVLWALAFAGAFVAWALTPPEGDGFIRGLNRIGVFLRLQALAFGLAVVAWIMSGKAGALKGAMRLPVILEGLLALGLAAIAAYAALTAPA